MMAAVWAARRLASPLGAPQKAMAPMRHMSSRPMPAITSAGGSGGAATAAPAKVTLPDLLRLKDTGQKITVVTAYDYPTALFVDKAGTDIVLVGDSLAMVALGYETTNAVTMDEMLHHARAVARGARRAFRVADMPFGSYQVNPDEAVRNAIRFVAEGNMEAVKLEGGREMAATVRRIVQAGIPVMGHVGLTPQSASALGGFRVQGRTADKALQLLEDVQALEDAGCFSVVLEAIPDPVARLVAERTRVMTIGIGAGAHTSGQVLVLNDMLGIFDRFVPRFCKQYAKLDPLVNEALRAYIDEVRSGAFPAPEHTYPMKADELAKLDAWRQRHPVSS